MGLPSCIRLCGFACLPCICLLFTPLSADSPSAVCMPVQRLSACSLSVTLCLLSFVYPACPPPADVSLPIYICLSALCLLLSACLSRISPPTHRLLLVSALRLLLPACLLCSRCCLPVCPASAGLPCVCYPFCVCLPI